LFDITSGAVNDFVMNTKAIVLLLAGLIFVGAFFEGRKDVWENEFKECQANMLTLTYWETNQPPKLKEYIKARYYYLANKVPKDFVGEPKDFGAVSTNVADLAVFKGPSSGQAEYLNFLQRFNLPKSTP